MFGPQRRFTFEEFVGSPRSPVAFLVFAAVNSMIGLISAGNPIGFVFVPAFAIVWWLWDRYQSRRVNVAVSVTKKTPLPAKGLILLLSPYNPGNPALKKPEILEPLIKQITNSPSPTETDFDTINLLHSNLVPQIKAVDYHVQKGSLREIWLICTESDEAVKGSTLTADILEKYLCFRYGSERLNIHREGLTIKEYDYVQLWKITENIFRNSGYKDKVLLADVTGGNKMMSIAMAMACVPPRRRMQYMDSKRDWQGNPLPQGEISPILMDFDPIFYNSDINQNSQ